jgi:hypothetical protein
MFFFGIDGDVSLRAKDGLDPGRATPDERPGDLRADTERLAAAVQLPVLHVDRHLHAVILAAITVGRT